MAYSVMAVVEGKTSKINAWSLYPHGIYRSMVPPLCEDGRPVVRLTTWSGHQTDYVEWTPD